MGKEIHLLLHLLFFVFVSASISSAWAQSDDSKAMADLAKSLTNLPSSWKSGGDPCAGKPWDGVTCGGGRVTDINLSRKSVAGTLPNSISTLSNLQTLQLQNNAISGDIPSLSGLGQLTKLALGGNAFSSVPADFFAGLTSLQEVSLDDIPFAPWSVPDSIAKCASLSAFSASNATITGSFPAVFATMESLTELRLSYNNLTGELPASLGASGIKSLQLNNQKSEAQLSGSIGFVAGMTSLQLIWLQSNSFSGPIPDLSNLTALESFNVRDNKLTGVVPPSLQAMPTLKNVTLSNNKLQGPFPAFKIKDPDVGTGNNYCLDMPGKPCDARVTVLLEVAGGLGYPPELADSWTGNNPCTTWLGVGCDPQGKDVTMINLANQNFSGTISPAIANLTALTRLILNDNHLTGTIPDSLTTLSKLQLLDVSNNGLTGKVPNFQPSVKLKLSGNQLGQSGDSSDGGGSDSSSDGSPSSSPSGGDAESKLSGVGMIVGILIAVVILLACSIALFLHCRKKRNLEKFGPVPTKSPPSGPEVVKIGVVGTNGNNPGLSELYSHASAGSANVIDLLESQGMHMSVEALRKATDNFNEANILGKGGFGVVYKGNLNGALVAVKRSESDVMGNKGQQEFLAEIDVLRKVRHRHLVALLGYCNNGNERLLVYEYMSGGTLGQHLFDWRESGYPPLTWSQRITIALDVARGIEYLHSLAQETFIHRDLKPSNILLDKDMRAKVSDFGLVKLAKDREKSMMTRLAGTFGYLAPEYAITGKVTTKVDVYAYGVILMELISGRKVLDDTLPDEESHLVACFRRNMLDRERFMKYVDPTFDLDGESWRSLMEVADLARHCTSREPNQRPDMSHSVNRLSTLVDQWKPTTVVEDDEAGSSMGLPQRVQKWRSDEFSMSESFSTFNIERRYD